MKAMFARRSIRKYTDEPVPVEDLLAVIEAAASAPSAKNKQPWEFLVYTGESKTALLDAMEKGLIRERDVQPALPMSAGGVPDAFYTLGVMRQAPVVMIVLNPEGKSPFESFTAEERFGDLYDAMSIGAAVQNLLIAAQELGYGTLWIGNTCFAYAELEEFIGRRGQVSCAIAMGKADEAPRSRPRKPFEKTAVFYN